MNVTFAHPYILFAALALVPALLVFVVGYRGLKSSFLSFIVRTSGDSSDAMRPAAKTLVMRTVCFALAWIFLVVAAAGPRWGVALIPERQQGSSVIFVMDISRSMTVSDVSPSRLGFSARYAAMLVDRMPDASCGLVLVKGSAVLAVPLTKDHRSVLDVLDSLSPSMLSAPGSGTGAGITAAVAAFPASSAASRTIILFTDGDETAGSIPDAARASRLAGTKLVIVGVGTASGADIDVYPGSDDKKTTRTRLRDDLLKSAVRSAGRGSLYVSGTDAGSALRVLEASSAAGSSSRRLVYSPKPVERYSFFLVLALVAFCAGITAGGFAWSRKH
jgi:Ca-activated chloride channel family protein